MGDSLVQRLELEGARVTWLRHVGRAVGALRTPPDPIDAVICDIRLPDGTGEELFTRLNETTAPPPFLFVTGHGEIDQAVRLMQAGAVDYISKPFDIEKLLERLVKLLAEKPHSEYTPFLGISVAARQAEHMIAKAGKLSRPVLVLGGPGTGKALAARRIHDLSDRAAHRFSSINFAREPETFASIDRIGALLDGVGQGTLYIHTIGRLPDEVQEMLLARLEKGFDGRVIASCGVGPEELLAEGSGFPELLYRLDMLKIPIPPFSERPEDAVWLMYRKFAGLNARRKRPLEGISTLAEEIVRTHDWPGGGRELRARLSRAVKTSPGPMLQPSDLFPERVAKGDRLRPLAEIRDRAERQHIIEVLELCGGHAGKAAQVLKISRTTLWDKMQKLGIRKA
ncbi:MAG TPA: sigma-54-dependent Fis family transcriptional regulator [Rhizobiales bacterium]|nr:sigma-54-dependent Fis family transcriptional regulator [Hyphomicrobiales bacterium]